MAYPVDYSDVEARWRELDSAERDLADVLLSDATELLDNLRPTLAVTYAAGTIGVGLIRQVLVRAVKRVLANPDAVRAQSIGADGAVAITYGLSTSGTQVMDGLYINDSDLIDLDRALAQAGGTGLRKTRSVKFTAYPEVPNPMSVLPLP